VVPPPQEPAPLHVPPDVICPLLHDAAPQLVPEGNTHAPVASQSVAPQAPPTGLQETAQQCVPVPLVPHVPAVH
jgi:hypothetical protein